MSATPPGPQRLAPGLDGEFASPRFPPPQPETGPPLGGPVSLARHISCPLCLALYLVPPFPRNPFPCRERGQGLRTPLYGTHRSLAGLFICQIEADWYHLA